MKLRYILSIALAVCTLSASAADNGAAFSFSRIDRSPASSAMAGATLTNTDNLAWGAFANPSLAPFSSAKTAIDFSFQSWMPSFSAGSNFTLGTGFNFGRLGLSVGGSYLGGSSYDIISDTGVKTGTFTPNDLQFGAGLGFLITDGLSVGANFKYFSSTLTAKDSYSGFGASAFVSWHKDAFTASAGIMDIGPAVEGSGKASYSLPTSVAASASYVLGNETNRVLAELDAHYFLAGGFSATLGAEYAWNDTVFARAGYCLSSSAPLPSYASVGAGAKFKGVKLNVSYLLGETVGGSLLLGIEIDF